MSEIDERRHMDDPRTVLHWHELLCPFCPGSHAGETEVRAVMRAPLGRLGRMALALIGKFPAEDVYSNLRRLKQLIETGKVTDSELFRGR